MTLFIFVNDKLSRIVDTAFDWLLKFKNNLTTNQIKIRPYSSFFDKQQATEDVKMTTEDVKSLHERLNRDRSEKIEVQLKYSSLLGV